MHTNTPADTITDIHTHIPVSSQPERCSFPCRDRVCCSGSTPSDEPPPAPGRERQTDRERYEVDFMHW